jgi:hypothetical protein
MVWDNYNGVAEVKEVSDVLLSGEGLFVVERKIRELFRKGYTITLMGSAMDRLDTADNKNLLREIIVQDINDITGEVQDTIVIPHEDIEF